MSKFYNIPVRYVFEGTVKVRAKNKNEAEKYAIDHVGIVMGGNLHSSLPAEDVDWEFPVHPKKELIK